MRSRGWVYLPEAFARQHPFHGAHGWSLILLGFLFLGPLVVIGKDFGLIERLPTLPVEFYGVIVADLVVLAFCWRAGTRLAREREDFQPAFHLAAAICLCGALLFLAVMIEGAPRQFQNEALTDFLRRTVPILVCWLYVVRSRRVNVTTRNRVAADDAFLRGQWLADETPESAAARRDQERVDRSTMIMSPLRSIVRRGRRDGAAPPPVARSEQDPVVLERLRRLQAARREGLISEAEFEAKRRELVDGL